MDNGGKDVTSVNAIQEILRRFPVVTASFDRDAIKAVRYRLPAINRNLV